MLNANIESRIFNELKPAYSLHCSFSSTFRYALGIQSEVVYQIFPPTIFSLFELTSFLFSLFLSLLQSGAFYPFHPKKTKKVEKHSFSTITTVQRKLKHFKYRVKQCLCVLLTIRIRNKDQRNLYLASRCLKVFTK